MSLTDIDPQFRLDSDVAPTYVVKDYNIETGEFSVYYNDGTLKEDDWYGPLPMDLDSMKPDAEEPGGMRPLQLPTCCRRLIGAQVAGALGPAIEPQFCQDLAATAGGHCGPNVRAVFRHLSQQHVDNRLHRPFV